MMNDADMSTDNATGDLYEEEDFDPTKSVRQIEALLKQMERWYRWNDDKRNEEKE